MFKLYRVYVVLSLLLLASKTLIAMPMPNEIPDSLRVKLDKGVIDNLLISEGELDSLLHSYPESDYLLARKINLLMEEPTHFPLAERLMKSIPNPSTFVLAEIANFYVCNSYDFKAGLQKLSESIAKDNRRINWLCRMYYAEILAQGSSLGIDNWLELSDHYFSEALEISPGNPRVLLAWARSSLINVPYDNKLVDKASHLLSIIPEEYDPSRKYSVEGLLWIKKNNPAEARIFLQKAINIDSNFLEPVLFLVELENQAGNYHIVEKILKPLVIKYPNDVIYLSDYADVLLNLRKFKDAIKSYEYILSIDTNPIPSRLNRIKIAESYIALAEYNKAEESLRDAQKLSSSVEAEVLLMVVHWLKHKDIKNEIINFFQQHPGDFVKIHVQSVFDKYGVKLK
ncbi:MAG: hypothetical protein U0264_07680 [Candidatus Kapaibacterium sp.]